MEHENNYIISEEQQYGDLFSSALSLYQILFNSEGKAGDQMKDYRSCINKDTLEAVLGKKEREKLHERISEARNAFGSILFSNYYQNCLIDYTNNTPERILDGQTRCSLHLNTMAINPHVKDQFLHLKPAAFDDPWREQLYHAFYYPQENPPEKEDMKLKESQEEFQYVCRALMNQEPDLLSSTLNAGALADKVGIAYYTVMGFASQTLHNRAANLDNKGNMRPLRMERKQLLRKINQLSAKQNAAEVAFTEEIASWQRLKDEATEKIENYSNKKGKIRQKKVYFEQKIEELNIRKKHSIAGYKGHITRASKRIGTIDKALDGVEIRYLSLRRNARFLDQRWAENPYFKRFLVGLSLFNLVQAGNNLVDSENLKSKFNMLGAAVEFSSIVLSQFKSMDMRLGRQVITKVFGNKAAVKMLGATGFRLSVSAGWAAAGIGCVVSAMDAYDSFDENDTDAAAAYLVSAVAGSVSAVAGAVAFLGGSAIAGPIGIAAAVIALAAVFVAVWLTDDDMQVFLNSTVFNNRKKNGLPDFIKTAHQAKIYLYGNRHQLADTYKRELYNEEEREVDMSDFSTMLEWIYNLITNFSLKIDGYPNMEATRVTETVVGRRGETFSRTRLMNHVYAFEMLCTFGHAKPHISSFDCFMLVFPFAGNDPDAFYSIVDSWDRHIKDGEENANYTFPITKKADGLYEAKLCFHWKEDLEDIVRKQALNKSMLFVFGVRIVIDEENKEYWPFSRDNEPRYAAYCGPLIFDGETTHENDFFRNYEKYLVEKRIFGTKEEIVNIALESRKS